jgi:hypothetical protein
MIQPIPTQTGVLDPGAAPSTSYIDWSPILAGTAIASAITIVLTSFGSVIGLSMLSPFEGKGISGAALAAATGLWVIWVALSSLIAGSYLTGRMRQTAHDAKPDEISLRDGTHGLVVWALSVLIGAMVAAGGIAAVGKTGGDIAKSGVMAASNLAGVASDYAIDDLTRSQAPNVPLDADTRGQIGRIIVRAGTDGQLSPQDRAYLTRTLAISAGITPAEAERRISGMLEQANQAIEKAKLVAEQARRSGILIAFLAAASLAVAAAASWWAAALGGKHRDENTDIAQLFRW